MLISVIVAAQLALTKADQADEFENLGEDLDQSISQVSILDFIVFRLVIPAILVLAEHRPKKA